MRFWVGVTDYDWFTMHASHAGVDEVNFWKPSDKGTFKALPVGGLFLFKLHSPRNYIAGGGFFAKFLRIPLSLAWDAFGEANGAATLFEMRQRISKYRHLPINTTDDPTIGCIILAEPFFFPESQWIPMPDSFKLNTVVGKTYESEDAGSGHRLWHQVNERLTVVRESLRDPGPALVAAQEARFGNARLVMPRLGQGGFRVLITDAYERRCAVTSERTLPVLEAAHIRPYAFGGTHDLSNGLLLRSDLHTLFDRGYLSVDPTDQKILVSKRIREEFQNGREYYQLHGRDLRLPSNPLATPSRESLQFHAESVFK
jgi:putative restriction endonuclease